jgi:hypothetical protein
MIIIVILFAVLVLSGLGGIAQSSKANAAAARRSAQVTEELLLATAPPAFLAARAKRIREERLGRWAVRLIIAALIIGFLYVNNGGLG